MKRILLIATFILSISANAAPVIKAVNNGYWGNTSTWDLNRLPQVGDTIVIPALKTVTVNDDRTIDGFVYVKIYGKLNFVNNNSTLKLGPTAKVLVFSGGTITASGSPSQKLRIGNNTVFDGNDPAVVGPKLLDINGITDLDQAPLPVKFIGFTVALKNKDVLIQWSTSEEQNANLYEVERSLDGTNWNTIAYVTAAGNTTTVTNYSFSDKNITFKSAYYRIKQVDMDSRFSYTPVRSIKIGVENKADIKIAAMPQSKVLLQFPQEIKGTVTVRFIASNGQVAGQQTINQPIGQVILNTNSLKGAYVVSVISADVQAAQQVIF
jgi:hypothetical protein